MVSERADEVVLIGSLKSLVSLVITETATTVRTRVTLELALAFVSRCDAAAVLLAQHCIHFVRR